MHLLGNVETALAVFPPLGFEYIPWVACLQLQIYRPTIEVGPNNRLVLIARPSLERGAQALAHRRGAPAKKRWGILTRHFSPSVALRDLAFLEPETA